MTHHDRTGNTNGTFAARLIKPAAIMFFTEQQSSSLTVPGGQWTCAVTTPAHTPHNSSKFRSLAPA